MVWRVWSPQLGALCPPGVARIRGEGDLLARTGVPTDVARSRGAGRARGCRQKQRQKVARLRRRCAGTMICCSSSSSRRVPVSVVLDKYAVAPSNELQDPVALKKGLKSLRECKVSSIAVHVWWGTVENESPGVYEWSTYRALFQLIKDFGFQIKVIMCFHGDDKVSLPKWVLQEGHENPNLFYTDQQGERYQGYLSLGVDFIPIIGGRTGVAVYSDFMRSFLEEFESAMGSCITEVVVGLGPEGELKYPSHPLDGRWSCPGLGEFQSYDCYMQATLKACAERSGHSDWGATAGPKVAEGYNSLPQDSKFFCSEGGWKKPYGKFYLQWYASMLLRHGHAILASASTMFSRYQVTVSAKIPFIHWLHSQPSRPAELTAGIYHTTDRDGYIPILSMFADLGVTLHVCGGELRKTAQPSSFDSNPEAALAHLRVCAAAFRVPFTLQNSGLMEEKAAWERVRKLMMEEDSCGSIYLPQISALMINYLCNDFLHPKFWEEFKKLMVDMHGECEAKWDDKDDSSTSKSPSSSISHNICQEPFCVT